LCRLCFTFVLCAPATAAVASGVGVSYAHSVDAVACSPAGQTQPDAIAY
jgi:hypothetical protein